MKKNDEIDREISTVLAYHEQELAEIKKLRSDCKAGESINSSISLLKSLGYNPDIKGKQLSSVEKRPEVIVIHSWDNILKEAEEHAGTDNKIEDLFTPEELKQNSEAIKLINSDFNTIHRLDKYDVVISASAAIIGALIDIVLVGIPQRGPDGLEAGPLSDFIRKKFDDLFPPEEMEKLANSKESKVPFDAQDNRNTTEYVEGLSAYYHRLLSLGHDPLLGFFFGVYDIMHGTMTTIDKGGHIVSQVMGNYSDRTETDLIKAFAKQIAHLKSDITTSMGLPAPLMGLFNLLQFGSIGEEEQTIAEIVQGMYYEGFDFIHFCSQSMSVIASELVVRLGYAIKRIKEGNPVKDSIPISLNREKHPKLATMLFISHTGATAINAGKVYFTKNPLAINYSQWLKFAKVSYRQLKWVLIQKPEMRLAYTQEILDKEFLCVIADTNKTFSEFAEGKYIIFE